MNRYRVFGGMSWFLIAYDALLLVIFFLPYCEIFEVSTSGATADWVIIYLYQDGEYLIGYGFFVMVSAIFQAWPQKKTMRKVLAIFAMIIASIISLAGLLGSGLLAQDFVPGIGTHLSILFAPLLFFHLLLVEFNQ